MKYIKKLTAIIIAACPFVASSQAINLHCINPTGRLYGLPGELERAAGKKAPLDTEDGMSSGSVRIVWDGKGTEAMISLKSSANWPTFQSAALVFHRTAEQVSFITKHGDSEPYLYSYFPSNSVIIFSTHDTGAFSSRGGARAKSFLAQCTSI